MGGGESSNPSSAFAAASPSEVADRSASNESSVASDLRPLFFLLLVLVKLLVVFSSTAAFAELVEFSRDGMKRSYF